MYSTKASPNGWITSCNLQSQTMQNTEMKYREDALKTLQHYVELRLQDADWEEYSKSITWSDEPSWDCKYVDSKVIIGEPKK